MPSDCAAQCYWRQNFNLLRPPHSDDHAPSNTLPLLSPYDPKRTWAGPPLRPGRDLYFSLIRHSPNSYRILIAQNLGERSPPEHSLKGCGHARRDPADPWARLLCAVDRLRLRLRPALREAVMIFDYSLAAVVTVGLMIYLVYALLKPERL